MVNQYTKGKKIPERVCYACGRRGSSHWMLNYDQDEQVLNMLCGSCKDHFIDNDFSIYVSNKSILHVCHACGTTTANSWRLNYDYDKVIIGALCKSCCDHLYYTPALYPKLKERYSKNRIQIKGKTYYVSDKKLAGKCTRCTNNVFDHSCNKTLYYIRGYIDPNNVLVKAIEVCKSCHASMTNIEKVAPKRNKFGMYSSRDEMVRKSDQEYRQYFKERRSRQVLPKQDTSIERIIQTELANRRIKFRTHKAFYIRGFSHQVDIFVPPNVCIEADGDYFHSRLIYKGRSWIPIQRDFIIDYELEKKGMKVIRLSEWDIKNNLYWCVNQITSLLK